MTCLDLDSVVYPYLDGELEEADRKDFEDHLSTCGSCAGRVGGEAAFHGALRRSVRVQRAPAPEALRAMLHTGIQREHRRVQFVSWARWGGTALLAAAASAAWLELRPPAPDLVGDEAALRFQRRLPLEVSVRRHEQVETWFDDKLDWRVPVPRLPNAQLAGARLSNVREHEAAYISYESPAVGGGPSRRMGLFIMDDASQALPAHPWPDVQVHPVRGFNVASWRTGDLVYELVSDLDADALRAMLTAARPATPTPPLLVPNTATATATAYGARRWPDFEVLPASTR
ncbi:MAG: zf-HC2 domain-containing protein [Myxococcaceae bacterium]